MFPGSYAQGSMDASIDNPLIEHSIATNHHHGGGGVYLNSGQQLTNLVSYNRFKNTSGVGMATGNVRRTLNEMTE